jgi:hypothetical protein
MIFNQTFGNSKSPKLFIRNIAGSLNTDTLQNQTELNRLIQFYTTIQTVAAKEEITRYFTIDIDHGAILSKELLERKDLNFYNKLTLEVQSPELFQSNSDYKA